MAALTNNPVVLVIEDDPPVRELLQDVLGEIDYEVVAVHDGSAALQVIRSLRVGLITLDLDLPGLTGSELLRVIHERVSNVPPVIIITSGAPVTRDLQAQAQAVVMKPFDVDELISIIRGLLPAPASRGNRDERAG